MRYKNNKFYIENVSVNSICKLTNTPTYIYSYKKIKENILGFKKLRYERDLKLSETDTHPISGGNAPAAPPITIFW